LDAQAGRWIRKGGRVGGATDSPNEARGVITVAAARRDLGHDTDTREYTDKHGNRTVMDVSGLRGRTAVARGR
jgi:hypothetical protein